MHLPLSVKLLTVISADNLDYLHSYARVFKGTQKSSWHGTTVQLVQPLPSIVPVQGQTSLAYDIAQLQLTTSSPSESTSEEVLSGMLPSITTLNSQITSNSQAQCAHETISRKRPERSSPLPSPLKLTRSPAAKVQRRAEQSTREAKIPHQKNQLYKLCILRVPKQSTKYQYVTIQLIA